MAQQARRRLPRGVVRIVCVVVVVCWAVGTCAAPSGGEAGVSATMTVGATVVAYAAVESVKHDGTLILTDDDVARGYVDLERGASLTVRTNSARGYWLGFELASEVVSGLTVSGLGEETFMRIPGASVFQPTHGFTRQTIELRIRFHVSPDATPGVYPWPLAFAVTPLQAGD